MIRWLLLLLYPSRNFPPRPRDEAWRHVPPPNWACKRSGVEIW